MPYIFHKHFKSIYTLPHVSYLSCASYHLGDPDQITYNLSETQLSHA